MDLDFIKEKPWADAEDQLSKRFKLTISPMCDRTIELRMRDVSASDYKIEDIKNALTSNTSAVTEFGGRWYADCMGHDYGEEWDPEEGNQQEEDQELKTVGIGQGFLIKYTLLYMYAKDKPGELHDFIKRLGIPHARKVAKDVKRVFEETTAQ